MTNHSIKTQPPSDRMNKVRWGCVHAFAGGNRLVMLRRLMPRVDRLWSVAEVAGARMPRLPRR